MSKDITETINKYQIMMYVIDWKCFKEYKDNDFALEPINEMEQIVLREDWNVIRNKTDRFYDLMTDDNINEINHDKMHFHFKRNNETEEDINTKNPQSISKEKIEKKYVYILKYSDAYKIGISNDVEKRLENIKKEYRKIDPIMPYDLKIINYYKVKNAYKMEDELHDFFKGKRLNGEWFELNQTDLQLIYDLIKESENGELNPGE